MLFKIISKHFYLINKSLMDLNNNLMSREYANEYTDLDHDQLQEKAMNDDVLITSLSDVQDNLGVTDKQVFVNVTENQNRSYTETKFVRVFVPDDDNSKTHIMNKSEYFTVKERI